MRVPSSALDSIDSGYDLTAGEAKTLIEEYLPYAIFSRLISTLDFLL
jgi:hypothetical protein